MAELKELIKQYGLAKIDNDTESLKVTDTAEESPGQGNEAPTIDLKKSPVLSGHKAGNDERSKEAPT